MLLAIEATERELGKERLQEQTPLLQCEGDSGPRDRRVGRPAIFLPLLPICVEITAQFLLNVPF